MIRLDISKGIDPILAGCDISRHIYMFRVDDRVYKFDQTKCPFTLKQIGREYYADKELVLKHG